MFTGLKSRCLGDHARNELESVKSQNYGKLWKQKDCLLKEKFLKK